MQKFSFAILVVEIYINLKYILMYLYCKTVTFGAHLVSCPKFIYCNLQCNSQNKTCSESYTKVKLLTYFIANYIWYFETWSLSFDMKKLVLSEKCNLKFNASIFFSWLFFFKKGRRKTSLTAYHILYPCK